MTIYIGTTNTDGSGSAQNLNADNSFSPTFEYISGPLESQPEGTWVYGYVDDVLSVTKTEERYCVYCFEYSIEATNLSTWNAEGLKEIAMYDVEEGYVEINNFVDVYFINDYYGTAEPYGYDGDQTLVINDAKRGYIDTRNTRGDPADEGITYQMVSSTDIIIAPHSNGDSWSNLFEVYTGLGSDTDGLDFENFEIITSDGVTLSLTANSLEQNSTSEIGLIIEDTYVEFGADILDASVSSLSDAQQDYLEELNFDSDEYSTITVTTDDGATYTLLMNEVDDLIAA